MSAARPCRSPGTAPRPTQLISHEVDHLVVKRATALHVERDKRKCGCRRWPARHATRSSTGSLPSTVRGCPAARGHASSSATEPRRFGGDQVPVVDRSKSPPPKCPPPLHIAFVRPAPPHPRSRPPIRAAPIRSTPGLPLHAGFLERRGTPRRSTSVGPPESPAGSPILMAANRARASSDDKPSPLDPHATAASSSSEGGRRGWSLFPLGPSPLPWRAASNAPSARPSLPVAAEIPTPLSPAGEGRLELMPRAPRLRHEPSFPPQMRLRRQRCGTRAAHRRAVLLQPRGAEHLQRGSPRPRRVPKNSIPALAQVTPSMSPDLRHQKSRSPAPTRPAGCRVRKGNSAILAGGA